VITFKQFITEVALTGGNLIGAQKGGANGDWGGSMPKLISLLPKGNWKPSSLKRGRQSTASGYTSDHFEGNQDAYAADFGLNSTFGGNKDSATNFAIAVARNTGASISSWRPYEGNLFEQTTGDGYRVQIIWLSNVGGNHYDHVHVGVKNTGNGSYTPDTPVTDDGQNNLPPQSQSQSLSTDYDTVDDALKGLESGFKTMMSQ
jgi:hypothetical protein